MATIDLNADVGESFGHYTIGDDARLIPLITSANIACGLHAGDYRTVDEAVELCIKYKVKIGAHIGFADLAGFGRRVLPIDNLELKSLVTYQIGVMLGFCRSKGVKLNHVKLHGALYNIVAESPSLSQTLVETIRSVDEEIIWYGLAGSSNEIVAKELNHPFYAEVFSDRAYRTDGSLVPRTNPNAMIEDLDEANLRMVSLIKNGSIKTITGELIHLHADTICIHGDKADASLHAQSLRLALEAAGIQIA